MIAIGKNAKIFHGPIIRGLDVTKPDSDPMVMHFSGQVSCIHQDKGVCNTCHQAILDFAKTSCSEGLG